MKITGELNSALDEVEAVLLSDDPEEGAEFAHIKAKDTLKAGSGASRDEAGQSQERRATRPARLRSVARRGRPVSGASREEPG